MATTSKNSRRKKHHKAHKRRRAIATHLETKTNVYDLAGDKTGMKPMGERHQFITILFPENLSVKKNTLLQYKSADGKIHCTPVQPRIIERGIVNNRLLAHLHSERFVYNMPYYRQQQQF